MTSQVLLLHGLATNANRTWRDNGWIDLLADAGREAIAPDLLGHGSAPQPLEPSSYDELEQLVLGELPPEPVDAIGFSLGARTVLALAGAHPSRFGRIVVAGVGENLFREDGSELIAAALLAPEPPTDPLAAYFHRQALSSGCDPLALGALLSRPGGLQVTTASLAAITSPVLVVLGDQDFAGPPDPLVEALGEAALLVLEGCDHFATPKDFRFIDAALEFLEAM